MSDITNTSTSTAPRVTLSQEEATKIAQAYARLVELGNNVLVAKETDIERKALLKYLGESFQKYGSEFLGCWFTLHREYEPLLGILGTLLDRIDGIRAFKAEQRAAQQAAIEKANPTAP